MVLEWMYQSGISGNDTLVAFDFDFTLKGAPNPATQEAAVRDAEHTFKALELLKQRNANMIVVTARNPQHTAWEGVKHRVATLGLSKYIGKVCICDAQDCFCQVLHVKAYFFCFFYCCRLQGQTTYIRPEAPASKPVFDHVGRGECTTQEETR